MRRFRSWLALNISRFYQFVATGTLDRDVVSIPNCDKIDNFLSLIVALQMFIDVGKIEKSMINEAMLRACQERTHPDITFEQFINMIDYHSGRDRDERPEKN